MNLEERVIVEMKPYLVDVPVRVNIWIRPECQKKQFEILKQARPSILFIQSDLFTRIRGRFDMIITNPPYIPTAVVDTLEAELFHEPRIALDGGGDGIALSPAKAST